MEAPFIDEISGFAFIKVLDKNMQNTMMLKLKFTTLDITKSSLKRVIFYLKEMLGILDLISLGYYKIKQGII